MCLCSDADLNYRTASNKQFLIELTLAKICQLLGPSPSKGGNGEGQLKPIAADNRPAGTEVPARPAAAPRPSPATPAPTPAPTPDRTTAPAVRHTAPAAPAMNQPRRPAASSLKIPSISIRHSQQQSEAPVQESGPAPKRTTPFSEDALLTAWNSYISTHPHAHILINTMRAANPRLTDRNSFTITVQNAMQLELMETNRGDIMGYVRNALANDMVDYVVNVNTATSPRHTLTDPELLEKLRSETPVLQRLIDDFNLHLA